MSIFVGLDPSFTRTGLSLVDTENKEVLFTSFSCQIGEKQFENVYKASKNIVASLQSFLSPYKNVRIVMECPLPSAMFSPGLYCLDTLIFSTFESLIDRTYSPTYLVKLHGKRKYTKQDSVDLALERLEVLKDKGYVVKQKRINHDCAESFLYLFDFYKDLL